MKLLFILLSFPLILNAQYSSPFDYLTLLPSERYYCSTFSDDVIHICPMCHVNQNGKIKIGLLTDDLPSTTGYKQVMWRVKGKELEIVWEKGGRQEKYTWEVRNNQLKLKR